MGILSFVLLDVVIGIAFIFLLLSLVCSGINEWISGLLRKRPQYLREGIDRLLGGDLTEKFYDHPIVKGLMKEKRGKRERDPSYIPTRWFSQVLMDILPEPRGAVSGSATDQLKARIEAIDNDSTRGALNLLFRSAGEELSQFTSTVEDWFDDAMDRVSGWFKRYTQVALFLIGLFIAVALNVDTLNIANHLLRNANARGVLTSQAATLTEDQLEQPQNASLREEINQAKEVLGLPIPLGWASGDPVRDWPSHFGAQARKVMGLLVTAAALSLGAPIWFDVLTRLLAIRGSRPEENAEASRRKKKESSN